jgi:hypothetical protein
MRRFSLFLLIVVLMLLIAMPVSAQNSKKGGDASTESVDVTCPDGTEIQNGVQVIVNMRPNFTYTATAIGVDGYDPVIGVGDDSGINLCNDNEPSAGKYVVSLPSTGEVDSNKANAQMPFYHSNSGFSDISLVIGSSDGSDGEFILVLEGMAVTTNDGKGAGAGDPYSVKLTRNMINSGVPLDVAMIAKVQDLDPLMQLVDADRNVITLDDGTVLECDDAGTKDCYGGSDNNLEQSFVQAPGEQGIPGGSVDSMISLNLNFGPDEDISDLYFNYLMTSSGQKSFGEYIVVLHMGVSGGGSTTTNNNENNNGQNTSNTDNNGKPPFGGLAEGVPAPDKTKPDKTGKGGGGVDVTCPDGTEIKNGVEVTVSMRPNFTYTATAIGVNGYDPVIGVGDSSGINLCQDDDPAARKYTVSLPSTGVVDSSSSNTQMPFFHSNSGFSTISLVVGSPDGSSGEFVLVLEGMAVTSNDGKGEGAGDPYGVHLTQNMVDSGVPLNVYMISKVEDMDPFMQLVHADNTVVTLDDGSSVECDNAGTKSCWGDSQDMSDSYVSDGPNSGIPGGSVDAMMSISLDGMTLDKDPNNNWFNYLMTSKNQRTFGDYIVVFHIGVK